MSEIKLFQYNNTPMEFEVINGQVFANATLMCNPFGKKAKDWFRLSSTQAYIDALHKGSKSKLNEEIAGGGFLTPYDNLIIDENERQKFISTLIIINKPESNVSRGGSSFIHEKLIIKLAQWLDVNFEVWCNDKIAELLRTGKVELKPLTQLEITEKWYIAEKGRLLALEEIVVLEEKVEEYLPSVLLVNLFKDVDSLTTIKEAGNLLTSHNVPIGRNRLITLMKKNKLLSNINGTLLQNAIDRELVRAVPKIIKSHGKEEVIVSRMITVKGLKFIIKCMMIEGNTKLVELKTI